MTTFAGRWVTSFGPMELQQTDGVVQGTYWYQGVPGSIEGKIDGERFVFRYQDPTGAGDGWFELTTGGQFRGEYRLDGTQYWARWLGQREWDGIWDTSFGRMRLVQDGDRLTGVYEGAGQSQIEGKIDGNRFVFRYTEPTAQGEGWFELTEGGGAFHGNWRPEGATAWGAWAGRRVFAKPGLTWLIVIEAHWQRSLGDPEYSYGDMLKAFFARVPTVAVRHRYFNDGPSLERWCRDLIYVPEPAIVLISSHGTQDGVAVHGHTIDARRVVDLLRPASNILLLHFATCLVLKEESDGDFARRIGPGVPFPISGYTTSVDWGGSAVLEFSYFDLILGRGMPPEEAAAILPTLIAYAGDDDPSGSPYGAAGFRFLPTAK